MANLKISQLTEDTAPTADDLVVTVHDPGGTPATKRSTITNFTKAIPEVVGDSGSGGTKGLVPAPGAGDAAAGKFLKADGTFAVPAGTTPGAHASTHESGGDDEIDVTGLSGVLADPQVADKIVETSGPTTLDIGDIVDGEFLKRVGSEIVSDTVSPGGGGDVVGPSSATDNAIARYDSTTGKLIQDSVVIVSDAGAITVPEIAAPSTPASGTVHIYAKSDGKLYIKDDAGTETDLTGGGGGSIAPLVVESANVVAQRNGTNPQTFYIYRTYDSGGTVYSRLALKFSTNDPTIELETAGGAGGGDFTLKIGSAFLRYNGTTFVSSSAANLGTSSNRWNETHSNEFWVNASGTFRWHDSTKLLSPANGTLQIGGASGTSQGNKILIGNDNTTEGLLVKRDGVVLEVKLGNDSAYAGFMSRYLRTNPVTVASLPASPTEGMMVAVTDSSTATWGDTITGGGANHVLAYYNGTNWTVAAK